MGFRNTEQRPSRREEEEERHVQHRFRVWGRVLVLNDPPALMMGSNPEWWIPMPRSSSGKIFTTASSSRSSSGMQRSAF